MLSRLGSVLAVLALAGCAVEHGNPPERRASAAGAPPHAAPRDSLRGPMHQVFDRRLETVAPGIARLTLRVVVRMQDGREAARAAMEAISTEARRQDSTLAAVRVLAYEMPSHGHGDSAGGMGFIPLAYLDWVPPGGWDSLTARSARSAHHTDVAFVQDLSAHPGARGERGHGR
jgi:hypothetical protein